MTGRSARNNVWASEPAGPEGRERRPRRSRPRGRRRWTAVAGYAGLTLLALGLAAAAFVLVAPPLDAVRDRLVHEVEARTGRTLTVAGPMSVSLYPRVVVSLRGIAMPPPPGMEGAATLTVPSLDAEMSLWSLLTRRPRLDRLILHRPTIELAVDGQGRRSWKVAAVKSGSPAPAPAPPRATGETAPSPERSAAAARPRRPRPVAVRVVDGTVRYHDARSGARYEIGRLDLRLTANGPGRAANLKGTFLWQGMPFRVAGSVAPPAGGAGRPARVVLKLAGTPLDVTYRGTLGLQGRPSAQGTVALARLVYKDLQLGPGTLGVSLDAGIAKLTLQDVVLYGGRGQGSLTLDTTAATPALAARLELADVAVLPLLKAAADATWLDGRGAVTLALSAQGASETEIVETLRGKVEVSIADGAVTGVDIDRTMRELRRGRLDRIAPRQEDRTPFSTLTGTFDIVDGIAENRDLQLVSTLDSAHVKLRGEGRIELPKRRIDYTLHTRIESDKADGGAGDTVIKIGNLEFPVGIEGPLDDPEFSIKGQEAITDAIGRIGRNLESREVQDAIKGLLGGDDGDGKQVKPGDLIEKLFR